MKKMGFIILFFVGSGVFASDIHLNARNLFCEEETLTLIDPSLGSVISDFASLFFELENATEDAASREVLKTVLEKKSGELSEHLKLKSYSDKDHLAIKDMLSRELETLRRNFALLNNSPQEDAAEKERREGILLSPWSILQAKIDDIHAEIANRGQRLQEMSDRMGTITNEILGLELQIKDGHPESAESLQMKLDYLKIRRATLKNRHDELKDPSYLRREADRIEKLRKERDALNFFGEGEVNQ